MTVELFRSDPYRSEFVASVVGSDHRWVTLDQTCFWPGDLPLPSCDRGRLGHHEVLSVRRGGARTIEHLLADDPDQSCPAVGSHVVGTVDWDRRYRRMRAHTAQHLVELALRDTHDIAGLTLAWRDDRALVSLVLTTGAFDPSAVLRWVAGVVSDDLPTRADEGASGASPRVWHLDGHGHRPCTGLHVWSTGEVGSVNLHRASQRGVRVELELEVGDVAESGGPA